MKLLVVNPNTLYAEGETSPKMMSIGLHCRLVGRPGRAAGLERVEKPYNLCNAFDIFYGS